MQKKEFNRIKSKILKFKSNRNVLTLVAGTTIAQAITIAISPILTRLYSPENFGVFAIFAAIIAIVGTVANGRYELAIMLPRKDEEAINIFALGFVILTLLSFILIIIIFFLNSYFIKILGNKMLGFYLYFVPLSVFFIGFWNLLNYFNNRKKNYKNLSKAIILKSIFLGIIHIFLGYIKMGVIGLISGQIFSQLIANIILFKEIIKHKSFLKKIKIKKIVMVAKKYKNFPKYSIIAALISSLSKYLIQIFITVFYNVSVLGSFFITQRVLSMPVTLIANSIGSVFFQQAAVEKKQTGTSIKSFKRNLINLLFISLLVFPFIYFFIYDVFIFVFGNDWKKAGEYAQILTPLAAVQFVVSPLTRINQVYLKNKIAMIWQIGLLIIYTSVFFIGNFLNIEFISILRVLTFFLSIYYLLHLLIIYSYIKKDPNVQFT